MESLLNLIQAAEYINVSRRKMWSLAKEGTIKYKTDPLDKRKKLFRVSDLDKLKAGSAGRDN